MPQRQLPLECILSILHYLSNEYDTDTMARLLCVNKSFCAATLPFLYGDCFNESMHNHRPRSNKDPTVTTAQLIRTLLRQVHPQSQVPDLLKVAYLSQDDQTNLEPTVESTQPTPVFKYGDFLRTIRIYYVIRQEPIRNISPLMDYAATNRLYEKFVNEGYIAEGISDEYRTKVLESVLEMALHQQLTWTLCQDHPESVDSLTIPLNDIQRYIDHVYQFTSLSDVGFSVDGIGWYWSCTPTDDWSHPEIEPKGRDRFFEGMMEFVRRHTSIHKNVLQNVRLPLSTDLNRTDKHSPTDVCFAIQSLLPPFPNLRSIDTGWIELLARHTDTSLSSLESIGVSYNFRYEEEDEVSKLLGSYPPLLPRCRALKHLVADILGPDMFQWAVLEKKQKEAKHQQESIVGRHSSSWQHSHHDDDLVQLQSITIINCKASPLGQELNDIAFGFSDSLEEWSVYDCTVSIGTFFAQDDLFPVVFHGQGWHLPRLRNLFFEMSNMKLHFDTDALQRCCALESLTMRDDVAMYRHEDIHSWSVVRLPSLKKLDLKGSPALHYNMDSLHHSPCLEELTLTMAHVFRRNTWCHLIPSPEELEREESGTQEAHGQELPGMPGSNQGHPSVGRRPRYTWDWHLPSLRKLDLAAVFAFLFDFQWLEHLPNLQSLRLNTLSSTSTLHERRITLEDFSRREPQSPPDEYGSSDILPDRYVGLPKLESIELGGRWIFEENVLEVLCLAVAPNLHRITFGSDCTGYTLEECITLSRKMPLIKKMDLPTLSAGDEIQRVGLVPVGALQDEQCNNERTAFYLDAGTFCDILGSLAIA